MKRAIWIKHDTAARRLTSRSRSPYSDFFFVISFFKFHPTNPFILKSVYCLRPLKLELKFSSFCLLVTAGTLPATCLHTQTSRSSPDGYFSRLSFVLQQHECSIPFILLTERRLESKRNVYYKQQPSSWIFRTACCYSAVNSFSFCFKILTSFIFCWCFVPFFLSAPLQSPLDVKLIDPKYFYRPVILTSSTAARVFERWLTTRRITTGCGQREVRREQNGRTGT